MTHHPPMTPTLLVGRPSFHILVRSMKTSLSRCACLLLCPQIPSLALPPSTLRVLLPSTLWVFPSLLLCAPLASRHQTIPCLLFHQQLLVQPIIALQLRFTCLSALCLVLGTFRRTGRWWWKRVFHRSNLFLIRLLSIPITQEHRSSPFLQTLRWLSMLVELSGTFTRAISMKIQQESNSGLGSLVQTVCQSSFYLPCTSQCLQPLGKTCWTSFKTNPQHQEFLLAFDVVFESLVWSGYWPPSGSNRDRDWLLTFQKPKLTGPNRYKPVIVS